MERGASHDLALGVLGRIDRLDVGISRALPTVRPGRQMRSVVTAVDTGSLVGPAHSRFWTVNLIVIAVLGSASWWLWTTNSWQNLWPSPAADVHIAAIPEITGALPVPSVAEAYLMRGRALFDGGHLRDALSEFDRVPAGDPLRADADAMRARIQNELLALALAETATGAPRPSSEPRGQQPE
jgi:hypothetical protein